jgi:deazaflavin-dependent oxidoreductase (nitroreductase family)
MSAKNPKPWTKRQEQLAKPVIRIMSGLNTWLYRLSGGKIWGRWLQGAPIMLMTTTGRKTGQPHTTPLLYLREGDDLVTVASKGGMANHPLWFRNLEVNPDVEIEIGTQKQSMRARRATDEEKTRLWPKLVAMYSDYADYQARTARNIPVVIISPR